ncbi:hypothetical protein MAR_017907 [Mya arenaria]|uniref:Uncharacterized protein n=1 Tax=Mya arenaria TaxID=6604 RepID=A0ABY7EFL9_MYAAR|nr:hypothetical protein MAR_017907 [Mya arenaria]
MVGTSKERVANWRKRMKEDPIKYAQYKLKEHERYLKNKERGVVKSIDNMTPREQNKTRRAWRKSQRARTKRIKDMNAMMTPPTSPDENRFQQNSRREAAQRNGRRKKAPGSSKSLQKDTKADN